MFLMSAIKEDKFLNSKSFKRTCDVFCQIIMHIIEAAEFSAVYIFLCILFGIPSIHYFTIIDAEK